MASITSGTPCPFGFRGEPPHKKDDDQAAEDRREQDEVAEPARAFHGVGVIDEAQPAIVGSVVHEGDQGTKDHRADSGHHADHQGKTAQREQANAPILRRILRAGADDDMGY